MQAPPAALAPLCHSAMPTRLPQMEYRLPASLHPLLLFVCTGQLKVQRTKDWALVEPLSLCGPTRAPQTVRASTGTWLITVSIKPGQLHRLCNAHPLAVREQCVALRDTLSPDDLGPFLAARACLSTAGNDAQAICAVWHLLLALHTPRRHRERALVLCPDWTGLPAPRIAAHHGLSLRQFERRFQASYGQSLRGFRQQLRFSQALTTLLHATPAAPWAERALQWGYCDQAHLTHDFLRFIGFPPATLARSMATRDATLWPLLAARHRMAQLFGSAGY